MDVKLPSRLQCSFTTTADEPIVLSDKEQLDVKLIIRLLCSFGTNADDPIVLLDDEPVEQVDVKPLILAKFSFTTSSEEPIVLLDTEENPPVTPTINNENQQPTSGSATAPNKPKYHHIKHERNYSCYICAEQFEMQSSFITHHNEQHPDDCFKCEFCDSYFETSNGHQYSHLYMKYKCNEYTKFFQFPYQLKNHLTQHTGVGKHLCSICPKTFRSKCSKDFHEKTYNVRIKCDLCPMSTSKEFNSTVALHIHQCGMLGPGWTKLCDKNYK